MRKTWCDYCCSHNLLKASFVMLGLWGNDNLACFICKSKYYIQLQFLRYYW